MPTDSEIFTDREDRERVLSAILSHHQATPGTTLIGYVDRATLKVGAVRRLPTPDPILDAESCFPDEFIHQISSELRAVAEEIAPARRWNGDRWSEMPGELVTVVCRDGERVITPAEVQYWWGWRYSNHLTAAFDGDVYAVTPGGWVGLVGEWSGDFPALPATAATIDGAPTVLDAEAR